MPLKSESLPHVIGFFTSSAWHDLRQLIEAGKPAYPPVAADALTTTSQCRRREGYELCIDVILREVGAAPSNPEQVPEVKTTGNPMADAMNELISEGKFVDTQTD